MAGGQLTLNDVVGSLHQGRLEGQQQAEYQRQMKERAVLDEADKAATGVIESSKAEWAMNGAQGTYKPNDMTMFKAAEARSQALAKNGHWGGFMKNEVAVQQQRTRARSSAMQQYELDGDADKLARTVYPTFFDGKEIVGTELVKGGAGSLKGAPAGPDKLRFKFSDGSTNMTTADEIVKRIKMSLVDPAAFAEKEIALNMAAAKAKADADERIRVEGERGKQDRQTENLKTDRQIQVEEMKSDRALTLADVNNKADAARSAGNNSATLAAAATGAAATKYAADQRVVAAKEGKKATGAADKVKDFKAVHDEVTRVIGEKSNTLMGSGGRISGEDTLTISKAAKKAMDDYDLEPADAIKGAIDHFVKSKVKAPK